MSKCETCGVCQITLEQFGKAYNKLEKNFKASNRGRTLAYEELFRLRAWNKKALPWVEDQYFGVKNVLEGEEDIHPKLRTEYEGYLKELTELLQIDKKDDI